MVRGWGGEFSLAGSDLGHSATLVLLARSINGLAHSLCSLPCWTVEFFEHVFTLLSRFTGRNAFMALTRNPPRVRKGASEPIPS